VDEAPVPDANPRSKRFHARGYRFIQENALNQKTFCRSVAGAHAADVVAVGVELANPDKSDALAILGKSGQEVAKTLIGRA
jgi:hypothetical protein